ncbi:type II toxin-antitoxin system RelE/ParE family toxin [Photobacterium satsumensis]|uniref:type II toxin-antitoxin system RelE/ParE family toxin n=1 Tax=Photobacterium satsumensis TaxID=2910239 RepID=UPI003D114E47
MITFILNDDISYPLFQFFDKTSEKLALNIYKKFKSYEVHGDIYHCNHLKVLNSKIWKYKGLIYKLRVDNGSESARVLFTKTKSGDVVILHAFFKTTRKTPKKEAKQAITVYQIFDSLDKKIFELDASCTNRSSSVTSRYDVLLDLTK